MKYLIEEKDLLNLLIANHELIALEYGGVDNWGWYGASIGKYVRNWAKEKNLPMDNNKNYYIKDIAKDDLKNYQKYKET